MSSTTEFGDVASIRSLPRAIAGFFQWWGRELAACVPSGLRSILRRRSGTLIIALEPGEAVLRFRKPGTMAAIGRVAYDPAAPGAVRSTVAGLVSKFRRRAVQTVLVLSDDQILRRTVELPLAARENLREVVSFEMDRYTPFSADDVMFDVHALGVDAEAQTVSVDLAAVPRAAVAALESAIEAWGLTADTVCFADERETDAPETKFVFRRPEVRRPGFAGRLAIGLWICAMVMAAALVAMPMQRQQAMLAQYEAQLDARRAEAAAVEILRRRVTETAGVSDLLVQRKASHPAAVALLHEITRLLPDDTWLLQLRVVDNQLTMAGYSGAASALIPILEASDLFAEVRFEAPVTLDGRIGLERFNLSAEITGDAEGGT